MPSNQDKVQGFEYLIFKLNEWHEEVTNKNTNDIGVLKSLKLLFFVSAVNSSVDNDNTLIDNLFDKFVAMPYGHVESDVYDNLKNNSHINIDIDRHSSSIKESFDPHVLNLELRDSINSSIEEIRRINNDLITYPTFDLVDLSHKWFSWKTYFNKAKEKGLYSVEIPASIIKNEEKFFILN